MEDRQFDELTKTLAGSVSRRTAVKAALVTALGGVFALGAGSRAARAADCKGLGDKCSKNDQCCSGVCDPSTGTCGCGPGMTLCNGSCTKSCPSGQILTGDCSCVCAPGTVPYGTGGCGPICTGGKVLNPTSCQCECPPGTQECNGLCVGPPICNGICCNAGETCCSGSRCTNLATDTANCGACGHACDNGCPACQSGTCKCCSTCVTLSNGTCAKPCNSNSDCASGFCAEHVGGASFCAAPPTGSVCFGSGSASRDNLCPAGEFCNTSNLCFPASC